MVKSAKLSALEKQQQKAIAELEKQITLHVVEKKNMQAIIDDQKSTIESLTSTIKHQSNTCENANEKIAELKKQISSQNMQYAGLSNFIGKMHKAIDIVRIEVQDFGQIKKPSYKFNPKTGSPELIEPPTPISADRQLGKIEGMLQGILAKYNLREYENLEDMGATESPYAKNLPF